MNIQVHLFGQLTEITGNSIMTMNNISETNQLMEKILSDFPKLKNIPIVIAVNKQIVNENCLIKTSDTVVLLPPYSGG